MKTIFIIIALFIFSLLIRAKKQKNSQYTPINKPREIPANWRKYEINPHEDLCSCPDWKMVRKNFPQGDPRRLCKHLCSFFGQKEIPARHQLYKNQIMHSYETGRGINPYQEIEWLDYENEKIMISYPSAHEIDLEEGQAWASIYFQNQRHGFNAGNGCWTHYSKEKLSAELIFQLETKICLKLNLPGPKQQPIGQIETTDRKIINDKKHTIIVGKAADGSTIRATLKPKGHVPEFEISGYKGQVNLKTDLHNIPSEYHLSKDDIYDWIKDEHMMLLTGSLAMPPDYLAPG